MKCAVTSCPNEAVLNGRWMLMGAGRRVAKRNAGFHIELDPRVCERHAEAALRQRRVIEAHAKRSFPIDDFVA